MVVIFIVFYTDKVCEYAVYVLNGLTPYIIAVATKWCDDVVATLNSHSWVGYSHSTKYLLDLVLFLEPIDAVKSLVIRRSWFNCKDWSDNVGISDCGIAAVYIRNEWNNKWKR